VVLALGLHMPLYSALDSFVGSIFFRAAATSGGIYIEVW